MVQRLMDIAELTAAHQDIAEMIGEVVHSQYPALLPEARTLLAAGAALYAGQWPEYEACEVGYHNFGHALDVVLVSGRMIAGWNKYNLQDQLPAEIFMAALVASLFHDSGYLKNKGDHEGRGGKYSFNHVQRSMVVAQAYLEGQGWPSARQAFVTKLILTTEFLEQVDIDELFTDHAQRVAGAILGTADLIAQMADIQYLKRINDLFIEFSEAYRFTSAEELQRRRIKIHASARQLIEATPAFYEHMVLPRLLKLGRMDQYLTIFFEDGRNPYLENITANLSINPLESKEPWARLGDILVNLGMATNEGIEAALARQQLSRPQKVENLQPTPKSINRRLLSWMEGESNNDQSLGEILIDLKAIEPANLRAGLLSQLLPEKYTAELAKEELLLLLQVSMLLQFAHHDPWMFRQVLEMTNETMHCEASTILLANPEAKELVIAVSTALEREYYRGRAIPIDKGLAGWVFSHRQPVIIKNACTDSRFDAELDRRLPCEPSCILAVPLYLEGHAIGVIEVYNKAGGEFRNHDMTFLTIMANVITSSLSGIVFPHD